METPTLAQRLFLFQGEVEAITKDATNPYFKSKYFDINSLLSEIKPILQKHGIVVLQPLTTVGERVALRTILFSSDSLDDAIESTIYLPDNIDPQKMGSTITYFRRYALQSLLLLQAEDDDGEQTTNHQNKTMSAEDASQFMNDEKKSVYTQKCPKCSKTMLLRPAGVTKEGKPYKAFYSCTKECNTRLPLNTY